MDLALEQARAAARHGDVPVGAVLVTGPLDSPRLIALGRNRRELDGDPTAHAEVDVLRRAAAELGQWRVRNATLYVTLEPCPMCAGALVNARVETLVYGAPDPKAGAVDSLMDLCRDLRLNHRLEVVSGVRAEECARTLREFFRARRKRARSE